MQHRHLKNRFVQHIPDCLEPGVLYVSMEFGTAAHCCCCGCGEEVVTPFSPTDWKMIFDGESVSLMPSIGNWNSPCRSHYWIEQGEVCEAKPWTPCQIDAERQRNVAAKREYYIETVIQDGEISPSSPAAVGETSFWSRIRCWLRRRRASLRGIF